MALSGSRGGLAPAPVPLLELIGVKAGYGPVEVLHGVDLHVAQGEVVALLGPNGAGKSTTLRVAAGLHPPLAGSVRVAGRPVTGVPAEELARRGLCTIPEGRGVFPSLTVRENLRMATFAGAARHTVEEVACTRFPALRSRLDQTAGTLSGGEQQMLAVARAVATDPALLLVDELSMGLAPIIVQRLYELVAGLAESGLSILVVEQFVDTALAVADRAAVMVHGRIVTEGSPDEVRASLADAYLGG